MAKVKVDGSLRREIEKRFKAESHVIIDLLYTLEENPKKGKALFHVNNIVLKEIKYKSFRFYFITDGYILRFGTKSQLTNLLIRFIRMSEKKEQQTVLNNLKDLLHRLRE